MGEQKDLSVDAAEIVGAIPSPRFRSPTCSDHCHNEEIAEHSPARQF